MPKRARVKVTASRGPTRAQQAAEFSRKKHRQRRQQLKRRVMLGAGVAFVAYVGVGGWWLMHTGKVEKALHVTATALWGVTADAGFRLDQIYLTGRDHADASAVKAALGLEAGMPILALDLEELQQKLQQVPEIKNAVISRELPNRLSIALQEREPAAMWQHAGKHRLVDAEGIVLASDKYTMDASVPIIVGEDAPEHVRELLAVLNAAPSVKPQVAAAVRVGDRRWNLRLVNNVTVMLPQSNPQDAWVRFSQLVDREGLLTKAIRSVDMRVEDRVFIMPMEQQKSPITLTTARDT